MFNQPEPAFHGVVYAKDFPGSPFAVGAAPVMLRNEGAALAPYGMDFDAGAWIKGKGLARRLWPRRHVPGDI